ncbi:hypothetical protein PFISCL1PPCAC_7447, partial [Pristionchus fissidentatus]
IEQNSNWRATSDDVYNKLLPEMLLGEMLGEFPPLKISEDSWTKPKDLGEKVLLKWNPRKCLTIVINMDSSNYSTISKSAIDFSAMPIVFVVTYSLFCRF